MHQVLPGEQDEFYCNKNTIICVSGVARRAARVLYYNKFVYQVSPGEQKEFCIVNHLLYQVLPGEEQEFCIVKHLLYPVLPEEPQDFCYKNAILCVSGVAR